MAIYTSAYTQPQIDEAVGRVIGAIAYSPTDFSGMGRVVLPKNIQSISGTNKNVLTQAMMPTATGGNTVYVVQYDFTLGGNIEIPSNCVLLFDGGKISGSYTLTGSDTVIEAGLVGIFGTDITFAGTWKVKETYPEWFGAVGDDTTNDTSAFTALASFVNNTGVGKVYIPERTYLITSADIHFAGDIELYGAGNKSTLHLGNSNTCVSFGGDSNPEIVAATITDGDTTIAGKTSQGADVTCTAVAKGQITLKVSDASKFDVDGYYAIQDICDFSFDNSRSYYRQGEFIKIAARDTTNNTITLYNGLYGTYGTDENFEGYVERSNRDLFEQRFLTCIQQNPSHRTIFVKCNFRKVNLHDFKVYSTGNGNDTLQGYYALNISWIRDSKVSNVDVTTVNGSHVAMLIASAYNSSFTDSRVCSDFQGADNYGCRIDNIQHFIVSNCSFHGRSHTIATGGGGDKVGAIISRDFTYERLTFEHHLSQTGSFVLDVHSGAEYYTYKDIDCPTYCCDTGGYYVTIENCRFYYISTSFHCSGLTIRNCEETYPQKTSGDGLLYFSNPWHDYSNDVLLIEGVKSAGFSFNGSDSQGSNYRIGSLIIRNCQLSDYIRIRYNFSDNVFIEGNRIISSNADYPCINFYNGRVYRANKPQTTIIIRNNYIVNTVLTTIWIDREINSHKTDNVYIQSNTLIGKSWMYVRHTENCYILNNYIENTQNGLYFESANAVIKGNRFLCSGIWLKSARFPDTTPCNVVVDEDNTFSSGTNKTSMQIHDVSEVVLPFGTQGQRPTTLGAGDFGQRFYNTTASKYETWNGTAWVGSGSQSYSDIGYSVNAVNNSSSSLSLDGTIPVHIVTTTVDISSGVTLSANPADGHSCHVMFASASGNSVKITYDSTNRVTPDGGTLELTIPTSGYTEVDFFKANGKVYVRGV